MPCFRPLQAFPVVSSSTGKTKWKFDKGVSRAYKSDPELWQVHLGSGWSLLPCGQCKGCRAINARYWGIRMRDHASLYEDNCFLTLTYAPEHLPLGGSLVKRHPPDFIKRLRSRFPDRKISAFYCGEYGEELGRPHYHVCLFNFDFPDKQFSFKKGRLIYYVSSLLQDLWPFGRSVISDLTYQSACYTARYCLKKITGPSQAAYYGGRLPEFANMSNRPAIGRPWIERYFSDVYPSDEVVVYAGDPSDSFAVKLKPPRYYDKYLKERNPLLYEDVKFKRRFAASQNVDEASWQRLLVKEKCFESRMSSLVRSIEQEAVCV